MRLSFRPVFLGLVPGKQVHVFFNILDQLVHLVNGVLQPDLGLGKAVDGSGNRDL